MNNQSAQPSTSKDIYEVHSIFYSIQGEGPFTGTPAVFVRLAGCNIQCPSCDTLYTSGASFLNEEQVLRRIRLLMKKGLVVITGGEPFRQDIGLLISRIFYAGYKIQIETNGTLYQSFVPEQVYVVCSPKVGVIHPKLLPHIKAFKYVIEADRIDPEDGLPLSTMGYPVEAKTPRPPKGNQKQIFVSPLDTGEPAKNKRNLEAAVKSCLRFGYRLCIQIHKIAKIE